PVLLMLRLRSAEGIGDPAVVVLFPLDVRGWLSRREGFRGLVAEAIHIKIEKCLPVLLGEVGQDIGHGALGEPAGASLLRFRVCYLLAGKVAVLGVLLGLWTILLGQSGQNCPFIAVLGIEYLHHAEA